MVMYAVTESVSVVLGALAAELVVDGTLPAVSSSVTVSVTNTTPPSEPKVERCWSEVFIRVSAMTAVCWAGMGTCSFVVLDASTLATTVQIRAKLTRLAMMR